MAAVPAIPGWLENSDNEQIDLFMAVWRRVLDWDAKAGVTPGTAGTVLIASHAAIRQLTPCDVGDPFMQDEQLQRTLLRRHMLVDAVAPPAADADADAATSHLSLDGTPVQVRAGPTFAFAGDGGPAMPATPLGDGQQPIKVYLVHAMNVSCSEVTDAIGRHPQPNPFLPYQPEPEAP